MTINRSVLNQLLIELIDGPALLGAQIHLLGAPHLVKAGSPDAVQIGGSRSRLTATIGDLRSGAPGLVLPRRERPAGPRAMSLPGCPGHDRGDDIGSVPVKAGPCPVVAHRGARAGMRGGVLDVAERYPGIEGRGAQRVPQRVRADLPGDPGAAGHPADDAGDAGGAVPVQPLPCCGSEQPTFSTLADRQVDRPGGARAARHR
jgi:hypothetical protein